MTTGDGGEIGLIETVGKGRRMDMEVETLRPGVGSEGIGGRRRRTVTMKGIGDSPRGIRIRRPILEDGREILQGAGAIRHRVERVTL